MPEYKETRTIQQEEGQEQRLATFKATQLIWLLLGVLEAFIALRILFKLIGVNPNNLFASLLYAVTELFVAPFASLISPFQMGNNVLEISSIIAMIIYLLAGWAFERFIYLLFYRPRGPVSVHHTTVADHTDHEHHHTP